MAAPDWIVSAVDGFGRATGLGGLAFDEKGAVSLAFENGFRFRMEYAFETLTVMMTLPFRDDDEAAKRLLLTAHPDARRPFRLRAAYLAKRGEAVLAVRLAEREVDRMALETVFRGLWETAERLKG